MVEGSDDVAAAPAAEEAKPRIFLSRQQIKQARDRETTIVDVPEWGGSVYIVPMSSAMRNELESRVEDKFKELPGGKRIKLANHDAKTFRERMLVECVMADPEGQHPLFQVSDISWLAEKSSRPVAIISSQILRISGVSPEEQEAIEKNSERARSDAG